MSFLLLIMFGTALRQRSRMAANTIRASPGKPASNGRRNEQWRIYPNPTRGDINISLPVPTGLPVQLVLTDTQGRRVWTGTRTTEKPINISNGLPPGMYYLTIRAGHLSWNSKSSLQENNGIKINNGIIKNKRNCKKIKDS